MSDIPDSSSFTFAHNAFVCQKGRVTKTNSSLDQCFFLSPNNGRWAFLLSLHHIRPPPATLSPHTNNSLLEFLSSLILSTSCDYPLCALSLFRISKETSPPVDSSARLLFLSSQRTSCHSRLDTSTEHFWTHPVPKFCLSCTPSLYASTEAFLFLDSSCSQILLLLYPISALV